jgi:NitT/TauT family transport system permease protein
MIPMSTRNKTKLEIAFDGIPLISHNWAARFVGIGLGFGGWVLLALVFPNNLMPFPTETFQLAWEFVASGTATTHLYITFLRTIVGFIGAVFLGGAIGVLLGLSSYGRKFFTPYILVGLSMPAVTWAAVATLVFGFSFMAPVSATILTAFPFIAINVWKGVENLDVDLIEMSNAFEISKPHMMWRVILRDTAPALFAAGRFGLAISWKLVTLAEIFASSSGVGYKLIQAYELYRFEEAWAWALIFMVVILIIEYVIFIPLERRAYKYREEISFATM